MSLSSYTSVSIWRGLLGPKSSDFVILFSQRVFCFNSRPRGFVAHLVGVLVFFWINLSVRCTARQKKESKTRKMHSYRDICVTHGRIYHPRLTRKFGRRRKIFLTCGPLLSCRTPNIDGVRYMVRRGDVQDPGYGRGVPLWAFFFSG